MKFIHVGVGGFGGQWGNALAGNRNAKVVGVVDVSKSSLANACDKYGYDSSICFKSLKDALKNVDADAVVCSTPPAYHAAVMIEAMKAGLDCITEKPMADTMQNCRRMREVAKKTKRIAVVSQNYRYGDEMWTMANLVAKGAIGKIGQVQLDFSMGVAFDGFRQTMEFPLLIDMSVHHLDLIRFITGLDAVSVKGEAWNPPWSHYKGDCSSSVVFEMNNGARITYNGSWCTKGQFTDWNGDWRIEGSKGSIVYHKGNITLFETDSLYKVKKEKVIKLIKRPRPAQGFVLREFMKAVKSRKKALTDLDDNIHTMAMVYDAVKAVKTGRRVKIAV